MVREAEPWHEAVFGLGALERLFDFDARPV